MSEGIFFHSSIPNIKLYVGSYVINFKDGRYPPKKGSFVTDPAIVDVIKSHPSYGRTVESEEDRQKRLTPDPKVVEDLQLKALERLKDIPGVVPSEPILSSPPEKSQEQSQKQESDLQERDPSLTEISRMSKKPLLALCDVYDIEVTQGDTVAILRRRVKSWIKQNT